MPAGICTFRVSCPFTLPSPLHTLHSFSGCKPSPSHSGHTPPRVNEPKIVRCILCTCPVPLHEKHSFTLLAGSAPTPWHRIHRINLERGIISSLLCRVASKGSSSSSSISFPRRESFPLASAPPPKKSSNISPTSKSKEYPEAPSSSPPSVPGKPHLNPPNPSWPDPPPSNTLPNLSYWARLSALERI